MIYPIDLNQSIAIATNGDRDALPIAALLAVANTTPVGRKAAEEVTACQAKIAELMARLEQDSGSVGIDLARMSYFDARRAAAGEIKGDAQSPGLRMFMQQAESRLAGIQAEMEHLAEAVARSIKIIGRLVPGVTPTGIDATIRVVKSMTGITSAAAKALREFGVGAQPGPASFGKLEDCIVARDAARAGMLAWHLAAAYFKLFDAAQKKVPGWQRGALNRPDASQAWLNAKAKADDLATCLDHCQAIADSAERGSWDGASARLDNLRKLTGTPTVAPAATAHSASPDVPGVRNPGISASSQMANIAKLRSQISPNDKSPDAVAVRNMLDRLERDLRPSAGSVANGPHGLRPGHSGPSSAAPEFTREHIAHFRDISQRVAAGNANDDEILLLGEMSQLARGAGYNSVVFWVTKEVEAAEKNARDQQLQDARGEARAKLRSILGSRAPIG